jgi:hypothetical protein
MNTSSPPLNPSRNCIPQSGGHVIWWHLQLDILSKLMHVVNLDHSTISPDLQQYQQQQQSL